MRNFLSKLGICLAFVIFIGGLYLAYTAAATANDGSGPVKVVFIQTQDDADATLLVQNGAAVLIDAGEKCDAEHILAVLEENGVTQLNYFILSHGDADHIGGAVEVLSKVPAARVVQPYYDENENMAELNRFLKEQKISVLYPVHNTRIRAGRMDMIVYPALEKHYTDVNNYSLAVLVSHYDIHMLFTGDALRKRSLELEMVHWPEIDLYKVPHHGRANRETANLFNLLQPKHAVVTAKDCDSIVKESAIENNTQLYFSGAEETAFMSDGIQLWELRTEG